jgi:hypothetical protein
MRVTIITAIAALGSVTSVFAQQPASTPQFSQPGPNFPMAGSNRGPNFPKSVSPTSPDPTNWVASPQDYTQPDSNPRWTRWINNRAR